MRIQFCWGYPARVGSIVMATCIYRAAARVMRVGFVITESHSGSVTSYSESGVRFFLFNTLYSYNPKVMECLCLFHKTDLAGPKNPIKLVIQHTNKRSQFIFPGILHVLLFYSNLCSDLCPPVAPLAPRLPSSPPPSPPSSFAANATLYYPLATP